MLACITMTTTSTLGALIRESRLAKGMSMGQLASAVGRTAASVRRWERDEVVPGADVVERLAAVLELDLDDLTALVGPQGDDEESAETPEPIAPIAVETDAMPLPIAQEATALSPEVAVEPAAERRTFRYYLDHLFDPDRPYLGYLRATLTVLAAIVLLWILIWAVGELFDALGRVWDQFGREETETTGAVARVAAAWLA